MKYTGEFIEKHLLDNNAQDIFFLAWRGGESYIYSALLNDLFFSINNVYSNVYNTLTYINYTYIYLSLSLSLSL
ncbi:MAG: hypothetical protein LBG80_13490, partial [Bacteroidales bacterium]|nr:hypothetical protein [Bacteroidales bacterium]